MMAGRRHLGILGTLLILTSSGLLGPSPAAAVGPGCSGLQPAATLLFPYFEVDLDDPEGRSTLISIGNASDGPALVNLVVWTNCGIPVLSFPLYLDPDAVQPLNLRSIFAGQLPETGPPDGVALFPGCTSPLALPEVDLPTLRSRLSGRPDPGDGFCYANPRPPGPRRAIGYVTVDVVAGCSDTVRTPLDEGYFGSGGSGLASDANLLWGDLLFLHPGQDQARGTAAVPVPSGEIDPAHGTFYRAGDDRLPLGSHYRTRFLAGGPFDGGTGVIVWSEAGHFDQLREPFPCDFHCFGARRLGVEVRSERGEILDSRMLAPAPHSYLLEVGGEELTAPTDFGLLDLHVLETCPICSPPSFEPIQGWVIPTYTADDRFSVGLDAVRLDCGE
jgi:hypothetical protein